jgi:hypothetical protein
MNQSEIKNNNIMNEPVINLNINRIKDKFLNKKISIDVLIDKKTNINDLFKREIQESFPKFDIEEYDKTNINSFYNIEYNHKNTNSTSIKESSFFQLVKDYPRLMNLFINSKKIIIPIEDYKSIGNSLKDEFKKYDINNKNLMILLHLMSQQSKFTIIEYLNLIISNYLSSFYISIHKKIYLNYYIYAFNDNIIFFNIAYYNLASYESEKNIMTIAVVTYINITQNKYILSFIYMDIDMHIFNELNKENKENKINTFEKDIINNFENVFLKKSIISKINNNNNNNEIIELNKYKQQILILKYLDLDLFIKNTSFNNKNKIILNNNNIIIDIECIYKNYNNSNINTLNNFLTESYFSIKYNHKEIVKIYLFSSLCINNNSHTSEEIYLNIVDIDIIYLKSLLKISNSKNSINIFLNNLLRKNNIINNFSIIKNYYSLIKNIKEKKFNNFIKVNNKNFKNIYNNFLKNNSIQEKSDFLLINLDELEKNNYEFNFYYIVIKILLENPTVIVICSQYSIKVNKEVESKFFKFIKKISTWSKNNTLMHYDTSIHDEFKKIIENLEYNIIDESIKINGLETSIYTNNPDSCGILKHYFDDNMKCIITEILIKDKDISNNFIIYNISEITNINFLISIGRLYIYFKNINSKKNINSNKTIFICGNYDKHIKEDTTRKLASSLSTYIINKKKLKNIVNNKENRSTFNKEYDRLSQDIKKAIYNFLMSRDSINKKFQHIKRIHYLLKESNNFNINENNFKIMTLQNNTVLEVLSLSFNNNNNI